MMYASAPARFVPRFTYKRKFEQPRYADGRRAGHALRRARCRRGLAASLQGRRRGRLLSRRSGCVRRSAHGGGRHRRAQPDRHRVLDGRLFQYLRLVGAADQRRRVGKGLPPPGDLAPQAENHRGRSGRLANRKNRLARAAGRELHRQRTGGIENPRALPIGRTGPRVAAGGERPGTGGRKPDYSAQALDLRHCRDEPRLRPPVRVLLADAGNAHFGAHARSDARRQGEYRQRRQNHFPGVGRRLYLRGGGAVLYPQPEPVAQLLRRHRRKPGGSNICRCRTRPSPRRWSTPA